MKHRDNLEHKICYVHYTVMFVAQIQSCGHFANCEDVFNFSLKKLYIFQKFIGYNFYIKMSTWFLINPILIVQSVFTIPNIESVQQRHLYSYN